MRRRDEQHDDLSDLLKGTEDVAGVTADLALRKRRGGGDRARHQQQRGETDARPERRQRNQRADRGGGDRDRQRGAAGARADQENTYE